MDKATFDIADDYVNQISEIVDRALESPECDGLKRALAEFNKAIGERYSVSFSCVLDVFDREKERTLPLLNTGLASADGEETYRTWGDSTFHKYIADGEMQIVPHDRCPCCWGEWGFKLMHRTCPECGAMLGSEVKILLDTDVCPHCENGHISSSAPVCDECGFEIDPSIVVWG
jgi:hypothetical protein